VELKELEKIANDVCGQLRALGREWYRDSVLVCIRHNGRCEYCGFDLLSNQGICYHFWCIDHLLPQSRYQELTDHPENKVLACTACNSVKSDYDPNAAVPIYSRNGELTPDQRERFLECAKQYVETRNAQLEANFAKETALLRPFLP
jgi:CRISPR/Cas system Type II protein with McrA/HNH and RuvC-like nuclease domain